MRNAYIVIAIKYVLFVLKIWKIKQWQKNKEKEWTKIWKLFKLEEIKDENKIFLLSQYYYYYYYYYYFIDDI